MSGIKETYTKQCLTDMHGGAFNNTNNKMIQDLITDFNMDKKDITNFSGILKKAHSLNYNFEDLLKDLERFPEDKKIIFNKLLNLVVQKVGKDIKAIKDYTINKIYKKFSGKPTKKQKIKVSSTQNKRSKNNKSLKIKSSENISQDDACKVLDAFYNNNVLQIDHCKNIRDLIKWEVTTIGNSFWYILSNKELLSSTYEFITKNFNFILNDKSSYLPSRSPEHKSIRYSKTPYFELEDLVLLLRTAKSSKLYLKNSTNNRGNDNNNNNNNNNNMTVEQIYTLEDLINWQDRGLTKLFPYLSKEYIKSQYGSESGHLTEEIIDNIMNDQDDDHQRVFKVNKDGKVYYGAYQGLEEKMKYTELIPINLDECPYAIHLTKPKSLAFKILNKIETGKEKSDSDIGSLLTLGRYIHALGYAEIKNNRSKMTLNKSKWIYTDRLYNRFGDRYGIGVDLKKLAKHYGDEYLRNPTDFMGINQVNTIIFKKNVPNNCLLGVRHDGKITDTNFKQRCQKLFIKSSISKTKGETKKCQECGGHVVKKKGKKYTCLTKVKNMNQNNFKNYEIQPLHIYDIFDITPLLNRPLQLNNNDNNNNDHLSDRCKGLFIKRSLSKKRGDTRKCQECGGYVVKTKRNRYKCLKKT